MRRLCLALLLAPLSCANGSQGDGSPTPNGGDDASNDGSGGPSTLDASGSQTVDASQSAGDDAGDDGGAGAGDAAAEGGTVTTDGGIAAARTGVTIPVGGVTAKSPHYVLTTTTGESPGGDGALSSPSYRIVGGLVGATQGK